MGVRNGECSKLNSSKPLALAAEPVWLEVSRGELVRRQRALSELIGRMTSKKNLGSCPLSDAEMALLEEVWQMHRDILG